MLSLETAFEHMLDRAHPRPPRRLPLESVLGCRLAESVAADIDLPPFPKALVDGYAIRADDPEAPGGILRVVESIHAGRMPALSLGPGEAALIMTGAPMPEGADAVVMREHAQPGPEETVRLSPPKPIVVGLNWMPRGREMRRGEIVLSPPQILGPAHLGLLASVGCAEVSVWSRPRVVVVPTGDELVEPDCEPGPGQIRNSNGAMLGAFARSHGAEVTVAPIAPDEPVALREALRRGLDAADILVVAGGVSAGDRDLVPETLAGLGVFKVFHKVSLKPGKPLWFGVGPARADGSRTLVFGLPGNPVGAAVCALVFVGPAIRRLLGMSDCWPRQVKGTLTQAIVQRGDRPTYHPARLIESGRRSLPEIEPLNWAGSADLRTLAGADGFAIFPPGDHVYGRGDEVGFRAFP